MNIKRIEEITKEIRVKEKKQAKIQQQKENLDMEIMGLHDELATIISSNSIDVNHEYHNN